MPADVDVFSVADLRTSSEATLHHDRRPRVLRRVREGSLKMTKVELWMEGENAHLRVHANESDTFAKVKLDLEAMRDRLTAEIERGPSTCPYARKKEGVREGSRECR